MWREYGTAMVHLLFFIGIVDGFYWVSTWLMGSNGTPLGSVTTFAIALGFRVCLNEVRHDPS